MGWTEPIHFPSIGELQNRSSQVSEAKQAIPGSWRSIEPRQIHLGPVPLPNIWMKRQQWTCAAACPTLSVRRAWTQLLCPNSLVVPAVPPPFSLPRAESPDILPSWELASSTQQHKHLAAALTCVPVCSTAKGTGKASGVRAVAFLSWGPGSSHMSCLSSDGLLLAGENI